MSRAQLKWCMKAGIPAGALACGLEEIREYLTYSRDLHGTTLHEQGVEVQRQARVVRRAAGREIPGAADMEESVRKAVRALTPKGIPIDQAIKQAREAVRDAQKRLKDVILQAGKTRCAGAGMPEQLANLFRAAEYEPPKALSGRSRR